MIKTSEIRKFPAVLSFDWADEKHDFNLWDTDTGKIETGTIEHRAEVIHPKCGNGNLALMRQVVYYQKNEGF